MESNDLVETVYEFRRELLPDRSQAINALISEDPKLLVMKIIKMGRESSELQASLRKRIFAPGGSDSRDCEHLSDVSHWHERSRQVRRWCADIHNGDYI
jgi:hypothetical protein